MQEKKCSTCKHFRPPEDPKYHRIPEIAAGAGAIDDYGRGYMDNARCAAVSREATAPLIKGMDIPVLVREARAKGSECGPEGTLHEEEPVKPLLEALLDAITGACRAKY